VAIDGEYHRARLDFTARGADGYGANVEWRKRKVPILIGVAHIDAPLKISRDTNSGELLFQSN
jgi:hypothetical protein